jgi:hypothetical protein
MMVDKTDEIVTIQISFGGMEANNIFDVNGTPYVNHLPVLFLPFDFVFWCFRPELDGISE